MFRLESDSLVSSPDQVYNNQAHVGNTLTVLNRAARRSVDWSLVGWLEKGLAEWRANMQRYSTRTHGDLEHLRLFGHTFNYDISSCDRS